MDFDKAFQMGALACDCNLPRSSNPFDREDGDGGWLAWEEGYTKAVHQWRAKKRAEVADEFGDEAADLV